jgi:hypothetical protein
MQILVKHHDEKIEVQHRLICFENVKSSNDGVYPGIYYTGLACVMLVSACHCCYWSTIGTFQLTVLVWPLSRYFAKIGMAFSVQTSHLHNEIYADCWGQEQD